jgi:crossover junction endodeoxyribonuclease RuvC
MDRTTTHRILGIDPGLRTTGYGVIESANGQVKIIEAGVIRVKPEASLAKRVSELFSSLVEVIDALKPNVMALEELYSHYERPRTAILMGHARGVICLAAHQQGVPVHNYAATKVKRMLTGNGRAPKSQMQLSICREFRLAKVPEPPDVADALAIALCHYHQQHLVDVLAKPKR